MLHVQRKTAETGAGLEAGEGELVEDDRREAGERDLERVVMEDRDAEQRQREQDEVDRNAEDKDRRRVAAAAGSASTAQECGWGNEPEPRMRQESARAIGKRAARRAGRQ